MTQPARPQRIFLATDLSARSDRALARAAQLAGAWQSELIVAHAVHPAEVAERDRLMGDGPSWRRPESWTQTLQRRLNADLAAEGIQARSKVLVGSAATAVQQAVNDDEAGLVVLGVAKDARMERIQLGSTVDALVRGSRVPVLNVRSRARGPYRHVVIATDFSEHSMNALRLAVSWFDGARLTLFHAYMPPGASSSAGSTADDSWRATITQEATAHLARAELPAPAAASLQRVIERGQTETLLADYVASADVDLVVLGSHGRTGIARVLLGSTAENLLHSLDCDTLVVRGG
jgi:nucleotide-binding universal stress UspA family protein